MDALETGITGIRVITAVEGGKEADVMRGWLESRNDGKIYRLCHFSVGLNP
jgi:hypothetical protein